ncbi:hypothetical protein Tco_0117393 [Tanacetum coccineum]
MLKSVNIKLSPKIGGDDVVDVMDLRWRRGGDVVVDQRWLVMEEGDDGSGGGWPEFGRSGAGYLSIQVGSTVFEAGDEMDEDIQKTDKEETQSPKPSKESSTEISTKEPVSEEHQSSTPHTEQPESSHAMETDASDSEASIEEYYEENVDHRAQTDKLIEETMSNLDKISKAGVDERAKLLKSLNRVSETLEADSALKEEMKNMAESNTTISGNVTNLTKLLKMPNC